MMTDLSDFHPTPVVIRWLKGLVVLGAGTLVAGMWLAPQQTWANLLLLSLDLIGLGVGGLLWVALHYVTGARWSRPLRCVFQALSSVLPVAAVGVATVLVFRPSLYAWTMPIVHERAESPLHRLWLNRPFFLSRSAIYLAVWLAFAFAFERASRRFRGAGTTGARREPVGLSGAFLVAFGITCWLTSYDWIMSLDSEWTSTIFGVYNFSGLFLSSLAATTLLVVWLRPRSHLNDWVTADQLHDLGTLLFAFSSFWMYIWFCQYWLIWYANIPEETTYFVQRWRGKWPALFLVNLLLNWGIPFCVLLFRSAKRNPRILATVAGIILIGRWLDLFLMIFPSQGSAGPAVGVIEAGLFLGAIGVFLLPVLRTLEKNSLTAGGEALPCDNIAAPPLAST